MNRNRISRRSFLGSAGGVLAAGSLSAVVPGIAAAAAPKALDGAEMTLLTRVCRVLFPHDRLPDAVYAACVEGLDAKAAADPAVADVLAEGVAALGDAAGGFLGLDEAAQAALLERMQDTPFFRLVHGHAVVALYDDPRVWSLLGYEGPSFAKGGYLERGFDDIDWLEPG